jgi:hypothetical protein
MNQGGGAIVGHLLRVQDLTSKNLNSLLVLADSPSKIPQLALSTGQNLFDIAEGLIESLRLQIDSLQ